MKKLLFVLILAVPFFACEQPSGKQQAKTTEKTEKPEDVEQSYTGKLSKEDLQSLDSLVPKPNPDNNMAVAMQTYNQGVELYQQGKLEEALVQFKASLANYPENSKASHYLGRIYYDLGQKGLSLSYYEDAVRFDIKDTVSMLGIGQVYFDMGDVVKAKEYYDLTIEAAPYYGLAYYNRGTMVGMQKQYHSSLNDLNKAIELDPSNANAYLNRGLAHFFLKDMDKACEDWNQAADMGLAKGIEAVNIYCKDK